MILLLVEFAASLTESFWGFYLSGKIAGKEEAAPKEIAIAAVLLTICVSVINQYILFSAATSVFGVILMAFAAWLLYRVRFTEAIFIAGVYMLILYAYDVLAISFTGILRGDPDFGSFMVNAPSALRSYVAFISKTFLSLSCYVFLKYYQKSSSMHFNKWLMLLSGSIILYCFSQRTLVRADSNMFMAGGISLLLAFFAVYTFSQYAFVQAQKERVLLEAELARMREENYERFMEEYRKNRVFYHDLKNQYLLLKSYLERQEYEKAERYLQELTLPLSPNVNEGTTGADALDILIAYKRGEAARKKIDIRIFTEKIRLALTDNEMISLFGNLFDNAIEACEYVEEGERWIEITTRCERGLSIVKVENSYCREPEKINGIFHTGKDRKGTHGIGLNRVNAIVEKYDGTMTTDYGNGKFSVMLSFLLRV